MIRAFFAIPIQLDEQALLQSALCPLKETLGETSIRWTEPKQWHITVRFLGEVDGEQLAFLTKAAQQTARDVLDFSIKINRIASFPKKNSRIIAAHASAHTKLREVFVALNAAAAAAGIGLDGRRFRPHITLGKFQSEITPYPSIDCEALRLSAAELVLYESKSAPTGSTYSVIRSFPFGP